VDRFIENLIDLYEKMSSWEHEMVRKTELTLPQMHTIEILGAAGKLRMKDLSSRLGVTTGTLTVMIQRLEVLGMVVRSKSENDGRSYTVVLTPKGDELYAQHHDFHTELSHKLANDMSQENLDLFNGHLRKIIDNF